LAPKSLSTQLYQSLNIDRKNLENILSAIFNLYKAKQQAKTFGIGLEEFVDEVIAFLETRHDDKVNDKTKNHLIQVLSIKSISLTMTAIAIRTEADKLAVETGIFTDIRPIFYENDIKGSLILHNLKVNQSGWEPSFGKLTLSSARGRKYPYHNDVKEILFFEKIGFLNGLMISALLH